MTQTMQSISHTSIEDANEHYITSSSEPETKDNVTLLFSLCDNLNDLCIELEKLYHEIKIKKLEFSINKRYEGEINETQI